MTVGQNIKDFRKKKGLTQKDLAEKIGKSLRMLQKYEDGGVIPKITQLERIAAALDVSLSDLLGEPLSTNTTHPPGGGSITVTQHDNDVTTIHAKDLRGSGYWKPLLLFRKKRNRSIELQALLENETDEGKRNEYIKEIAEMNIFLCEEYSNILGNVQSFAKALEGFESIRQSLEQSFPELREAREAADKKE